MERVQKIIANRGYCSRRKAEELIISGRVMVNDRKVSLGEKVEENSIILIDGKTIQEDKKVYVILNKPRGYVTTTSDDKKRKIVTDLIPVTERIYPVGRLDYDTTGLLILTNDGELANILMHPKNNIDKLYVAKVTGMVSGIDIAKLKDGVMIDGVKTSHARVKIKKHDKKTNNSIVEITIHEGKNHQVKKMFEVLGYEVTKLKRERYAFLDLKGLKSGEYRFLSLKEVKKLYALK